METKLSLKRPRSDADEQYRRKAKEMSRDNHHESKDEDQANSRASVRFLILADTHDLELAKDPTAAFRLPAPNVDVVLHCGDLTENGDAPSLARAIRMLGKIPAELKLVIAGNHDLTLDREHLVSQGGSEVDHTLARALMTGGLAQANGVTFLGEGTHTFELRNGAQFSVFASPYTPQFGVSAFQYPTGDDRFNPPATTPPWATNTATPTSTIPEGVDIFMTHGPPKYLLDAADDGRTAAGCEHLRNAIVRAKPRLHCFGHVHAGYGAQRIRFDESEEDGLECFPKEFVGSNQARRKGYAQLPPASQEAWMEAGGEQCLLVNAAIECVDFRPVNAPWVVEMEFERRVGGEGMCDQE